jgi:hypothetical protein
MEQKFFAFITDIVIEWLTFPLLVREVPGSNFDLWNVL